MLKAVILLVVGIGVLLLGLNIRKQLGLKLKNCTGTVTGRVSSLIREKVDNDDSAVSPVYTYEVDGKMFTIRSEQTYAPGKISIGDTAEILVDPADPGTALIKEQVGGNKIWTVVLILLGIAGIAAGIALMIPEL